MIELRVMPGPTGRLLRELLTQKRVNLTEGPVEAIISYGRQVPQDSTIPVLNSNAGQLDKFEELQKLASRGVQVVPHRLRGDGSSNFGQWLGRDFNHTKGRDIVTYTRPGIPVHDHKDYYTQYIEQDAEYRVWTFRGRCLGVYEKVLEFPWKARRRPGIAWNWRRGYAFKFMHEAPDALKQLGIDAVRAVDLDFGAVDILKGRADQRYYVLEVNSAPGTQGPRQGLTYLATKMARWVENGFLKRNEWKER